MREKLGNQAYTVEHRAEEEGAGEHSRPSSISTLNDDDENEYCGGGLIEPLKGVLHIDTSEVGAGKV